MHWKLFEELFPNICLPNKWFATTFKKEKFAWYSLKTWLCHRGVISLCLFLFISFPRNEVRINLQSEIFLVVNNKNCWFINSSNQCLLFWDTMCYMYLTSNWEEGRDLFTNSRICDYNTRSQSWAYSCVCVCCFSPCDESKSFTSDPNNVQSMLLDAA